MAAEETMLQKTVEVLEKEITCILCQKHYVEPKVLPCMGHHYFCKQCILDLALKTGLDKPFPCPSCHMDVVLPDGNVNNLQSAFFINRVKDVRSKLETAHSTNETKEKKCDFCSRDQATAFCRDCAQCVCDECMKSHKRMKLFSGHTIATLSELKDGTATKAEAKESPSQQCETHDQPLKMYCHDCGILICRHCVIDKTHKDHNHDFVKSAALEVKEKLKQELDLLKQRKTSLSHAVEQVHATKSKVEVHGESLTNSVKRSFEEVYKAMKNYEGVIVSNSSEKISTKIKRLVAQGESLSTSSSSTESVMSYVEQSVEQLADNDLMSAYLKIQSRIDQEKQRALGSLEPAEEIDIGVDLSGIKEIEQLCKAKASSLVPVVTIPLDPLRCAVIMNQAEVTEINRCAQFRLITRLSNGMPTTQKCDIKCQLKSLTNGKTIFNFEIDSISGGEYSIKYTPIVHGPNELSVTINGEAVEGSPFTVFVHIQPGQLGKPVRCVTGFSNPRDITVDSAGKIIVTEQKNIVVLDETGKKLQSYRSSKFGINDLYCVAIDNTDGSIYITGNSNTYHKIVKLNPSFEQVNEFSSKEKLHFRGIAISGDEIMACQRDKGIAVYTKELEFVKIIALPLPESGSIRDISVDKDSNSYVSNYDNSQILVFSKSGEFSHSFGNDSSGVNRLKGPRGVCVAGQYVYVANWHSNNVAIFTTNGTHIASFGQKGGSEGHFKNAWGLCLDKDGLLYVCDQKNDRIHKYFSTYY